MDLLTTCIHNSELQVITRVQLISTSHRLLEHPLGLLRACCVFNNRSLATASNSGDSLACRAHVVTIRRIFHNSTLVNSIFPLNYQLNFSVRLPAEHQFTSFLLLLTLCTDRTENIVPNNSSVVAYVPVFHGNLFS
jgi:hypothetical protein